jgi:aminopeptidase-like protein
MSGADLEAGRAMYALIEELYPICRSITGDGVRQTLARLRREIPLEIHEVPSGTRVFDWTVPNEWNIRDAYIQDEHGRRVVDFRRCNLHVVNYSVPVRARLTLEELRPRLHSLPDRPDWVPYRTTYYKEDWGFCLSHRQLQALADGEYEICIDATLAPGSLTYGECVIRGRTDEEVLISCHCCHPSLANDNLSGIAVAVALARALAGESLRYTYRFLFIPGTIGSITWLALNEPVTARIRHGLVLTCVGDRGHSTYKRSRRGDALIDRAVEHVLRHSGGEYAIQDFVPYGYDERQYCSPGFDLPVGCLMRTPNGRFPEYHTSADDLAFVDPTALVDTLRKCQAVVEILEHDAVYENLNPKCEPQLGRRGLYGGVTGRTQLPGYELALLWVLNFSDRHHSLLDIAERAEIPFATVRRAAEDLVRVGLLRPVAPATPGADRSGNGGAPARRPARGAARVSVED